MKEESVGRNTTTRLLVVFFGSATSVFALLILTMLELEDFSASAFLYWGPRALSVVLVTTALGILVVNRSQKLRTLFGFFGGLFVAFVYLWITR